MTHCVAQLPYLKWKSEILRDVMSCESVIEPSIKYFNGKPGNATGGKRVTTEHHPVLADLWKSSYGTGVRRLGDWVQGLDMLGLAIAYQDNGTLVGGDLARLYLPGTWEVLDAEYLMDVLAHMGIYTTRYSYRPGQYALHVRSKSATKFFLGVCKFIHPSMRYKIPLEYRKMGFSRYPEDSNTTATGYVESLVTGVIRHEFPESYRGHAHKSYCIDVKDNHNFVTSHGEIVSNCTDAVSTWRVYNILKSRLIDLRRSFNGKL
jgi:hypothetical protein